MAAGERGSRAWAKREQILAGAQRVFLRDGFAGASTDAIDGLRSLLFYNGSLDVMRLEGGWRDSLWFLGGGGRSEAAGLEDAGWMVGMYLVGAAVIGYLISLSRDLFARRGRKGVKRAKEGAKAAV